jgi:hypothetical protein
MAKPEEHDQSASASPQAGDLRARLRVQEDEIDALMELWLAVLPVDWMPGHGQFLVWIQRYGLALVEKGITVAAGKLHQVTKEAQRTWTADDAIRYASGVMVRTQKKEREQRSEHDHGKSHARRKQVDQSVGTDTPATATTEPEYRQESGQQGFLEKSDL